MTSRTIQYQLTAQSNIDQVMAQITGAVQTLGAQSAAQIPKLAKELANAQAATSRAATAAEGYHRSLLATDTAALRAATAEQQLATATARTQTAWTNAASAAARYAEQANRANQGGGNGGGLSNLLGGAVAGAAAGVTGVILGGIKDVGAAMLTAAGSSLTLAGNLKQSSLAFVTMLGSATAARQELAAIRAYSDSTAFTFPQLQNLTAEFLGVGLGAKSALAQVKDLGDEVAGRGKSPEMLDRVSLAMSQVISKGRLMGDDARQFQEAGLPVWQILAAYLHTDAEAAQALSEQGRITADVWQNALHADAAQNFAGAAERASQSWNGLLSTLGDTGTGLLTTFGSPIIQSLEPVLQAAINVLKDPQVEATIRSWGEGIGAFIQQMTQGATLFAQLFGLQLPQIQAQAPALDDVGQRWNTISVAVGDVTAQTEALKDSEDGIRTRAEATSRAYEGKIQRLRDAATALDRQYDTETKIAQLHKLDDDIAKNRLLGKNIFTSEGRAAAVKAEQEGEQRTQLIKEMGHARDKANFADQITAVERAKQAAAQQAQDQIKGIEASIKGIQREAKAYDDYNRAKQAAIAAYRKQLEAVGDGEGATVGIRGIGTAANANGGLLDQFNARLQTMLGASGFGGLLTLSGQVSDSLRTFGGIVSDLLGDLGNLIHALGIDAGVAGALQAAQTAGSNLFQYLLTTAPNVADAVGTALQRIGAYLDRAIKGLTAGVAGLRALGPGATQADQDAFRAAVAALQTPTATPAASIGTQRAATVGTPNGDRPTRTVDRSAPAPVPILVGIDPATGNLTAAMRNMLRNHPELLDVETGAR